MILFVAPYQKKEGKKHEELLARQEQEDLQSLRQRKERKKIDPSAFSATEVPKDYVPDEQMRVTRSPSGQSKLGSNLREIQIPRPASPTTTSSYSTLSPGSEPSSPVKTPTKSSSPDSPKSFLS